MGALFVTEWAAVADLAGRQHGVVSSMQLAGAGITRRAIAGAVRSGRLHRLHRGVYAVGHIPTTNHARWMAAVLACGPGAVLSHRSAATLWRIREAETNRPEVTIPPGSGRRRPTIAIHRARLAPEDVTTRDGIPTTGPERILIDLTTQVDDDEIARALREALFRRLTTIPSLQRALERRPCRPLAAQIADYADTRSRLEDDFFRLLDRHGIPRPERQWPIGGHLVDFCWPDRMLVVETDGWEGHGTRYAFQRDRTLTNAMQLAGYVVLRLTAADVRRRPAKTAQLIRAALAQASSKSRSMNVASMPSTSATISPR
jgi:very-short-patch-repair endonuclease/predicted transcriptional regulator of viral defense system